MSVIEKLIKKAVDRNFIVYDLDAKNGELTNRLIAVMKVCYRINSKDKKGKIHTIYLATDTKLPKKHPDIRTDHTPTSIYGITIKYVDGMPEMIEKNGGMLVKHSGEKRHQDKCCVLALGTDGNVLLGSY